MNIPRPPPNYRVGCVTGLIHAVIHVAPGSICESRMYQSETLRDLRVYKKVTGHS